MNINCVVVDDEILARRLLIDYISKIPMLTLVATCANAMEAQRVLQDQHIDLLFLDIQMPDLTGISFLQTLPNKPLTIFTTAYSEYALKGYELAVLDYLLKPIPFDRFFQSVNRAAEYLHYTKTTEKSEPTIFQLPERQQTNQPDFIFVKSDYKIHKINHADIDYVEAYGEYILIFSGKEKIMTLVTMSKILEQLPARLFIRVHRSFIINFSKTEAIQGNTIFVSGREIPISKTYREALMNLVNPGQLF